MQKHRGRRLAIEAAAALAWTAVTLWTDRLIFQYDAGQGRIWVYKALFWALTFGLVHGAVTLVGKLLRGERFARRCVLWALPYFAVNLALLLLIWPGAWGNDDLHVLSMARMLQVTPWYHYLASVYQILVLMLVPLMAGTVFVQILVISGMTGYLMASVMELAENYCTAHGLNPHRARWTAVLYLPLLLPPLLLSNQEPFRPTWTSWTEMFLLGILAVWMAGRQVLNRRKMCLLVILGALTATWRSESIYYILLMPVFFCLLLRRKQIGRAAAIVGSILVILLTLLSNRYNNYLMGSSWTYQGIAFARQIVTAVKAADPEKDAALLEKIDPVFDVEACQNYEGPISAAYYATVLDSDSVTSEIWSECLKASAQLILRHPIPVLQERWQLFVDTVHYTIYSGQKSTFITSSEFYDLPEEELRSTQKDFLENLPLLGKPFNNQLRRQVMNVLMDWKVQSNRLVSLTWNMIPFFVLLAAMQIVFAVWRKWWLFWINAAGILHIAVVFVSAPTSYFMYYLAPYMQAAFTAGSVAVWILLQLPVKWKKKTRRRNF